MILDQAWTGHVSEMPTTRSSDLSEADFWINLREAVPTNRYCAELLTTLRVAVEKLFLVGYSGEIG